MKLLKLSLISALFILFIAYPVFAFPENNLSSQLSGRILLDVNNKGEAWYVYPGDFHRYYLGRPADAYTIMRNLSLGISNSEFSEVASSTPDRLKGIILLKTEDHGRAYYINPLDKSLNYLEKADDAYNIMRHYALGITSTDLETIPIGKIILDSSGQETARQWQYLGFWGEINNNYISVLAEPKNEAKVLGRFNITNRVKVLDIKKGDGRIWYQIDGGQYPGAYVDSEYVRAIAQPAVATELILPKSVKNGDYWVDVNLRTMVMALYKYDQVVMATYISIGIDDTPTIIGAYNVWLKYQKTGMKSAAGTIHHQYNLADVPWVMYYYGSYSIHGTYWHDNFGAKKSAGCTNATQGDAKYIFDLTGPKIEEGYSIRSTPDNPGVLVNNHF
ncbi:MAG TPA: L,D-transpeptidase [Candidatus Saccharimonadales bacterium]|nr:L,D-transpeptidase [Candidatus Saccharimonadales bacterium]